MIDPRQIDFADSFNPYLLHRFDPVARPADFAMLQTPLYVALRKATGYHNHLEVVPDRQNALLASRASYDGRFYAPPGSYLYAITAYSSRPEGVDFNIISADGSAVFASTLKFAASIDPTYSPTITQGRGVYIAVSGPGLAVRTTPASGPFLAYPVPPTVRGMRFFLQHPRAVVEPGLFTGTITNRAEFNASVQVVLWFMRPDPPEMAPPPNEYNNVLAEEAYAQQTVSTSIMMSGSGTSTGTPWVTMPENGRPLRYEQQSDLPAPGTIDFPLISFVVPSGYACAIKSHRHKFLGVGFNEGSGDLIWRITVDGAAPPGYDAMTLTTIDQGNSYEEISGAIIARSGQRVQYTVSVAAGSGAAGASLVALQGHYYPQQ